MLDETPRSRDRRPAAATLRRYNGPKGPERAFNEDKVSWLERQQDQRPRSGSRWSPPGAGHGEKVREDDPDPPVPSASSGGSGTSTGRPEPRPVLSSRQEMQVRRIYDDGKPEPVAAPLAAYLALLHVAGPMAREDPPPLEAVDTWLLRSCREAAEACAFRNYIRNDTGPLDCPTQGRLRLAPSACGPHYSRPRTLNTKTTIDLHSTPGPAHSRSISSRAAGGRFRGTVGAQKGHTTAPFANECQSFVDNVIAGLGQTG